MPYGNLFVKLPGNTFCQPAIEPDREVSDNGKMKENNYRAAREAKPNLTQEAVAHAIGVVGSQVSRFETGDREPTASQLKKMAQFLGVSVSYLVADPMASDGSQPSPLNEDFLWRVLAAALEESGRSPEKADFLATALLEAAHRPPSAQDFQSTADLVNFLAHALSRTTVRK
jgi:transcriptional regulator with XRE-family HTH domain